jgi:predicted GIY-YIG superfamily endonuclease
VHLNCRAGAPPAGFWNVKRSACPTTDSSSIDPVRCVDTARPAIDLCRRKFRQGSSVVEQGTHKPLVGSSNLPPGSLYMAWVYILRGSSGRHYIGSTPDLAARLAQHSRGHTHTTKRIGDFQVVAQRQYSTLKEARDIERFLKAKKNPRLAIHYLQR